MGLLNELTQTHGLGDQDKKILKVLFDCGGKATWTDFLKPLVPGPMAKRTLNLHLKGLVEDGVLEKKRERFKGRRRWVYVFRSREVEDLFRNMGHELHEITERLYVATQQPDLTVTDRDKRLIDGVHELLAYQKALTLMAMKLAMSAPTEEKAAHRFLVLMDTFTPDAAGNALWLCWLNKDIAAGVLEAMLPKHEA